MNKIEDIDFDNIDLSDFQEDVDEIRNDIKNIKKNKKLMKVLKKVEKKKDRDKKTLLQIGLYGQYYKKDIFDKYTFKNDSIIITNDAIDILDKPLEKLYIEPWTKKIEKDKEIERLNNIINELKDDIEFCLKSIKQECKMSTDERTRIEMKSCKQILEEKLKELKESK